MENNFVISSSPHIRTGETVRSIMLNVIIALTPAAAYGVYIFGLNALLLILISVVTAVFSEAIFQVIRKKPITVGDLSAVVTGLLLAMNVPSTAPWWLVFIGSAFAIIIGKQVFGGLGFNFINPALAARAMLMTSWPARMTNWVCPFDGVSAATPLGIMAEGSGTLPSHLDAFIGNIGGCIGETSALLLILGGAYLIYKKIITWHIPVAYIGTAFFMGLFVSGFDVQTSLFHLLIGGLMLGAFFMATDYSSTPITAKGKVIYGIGAGLLTILIRVFGSLPEGVSYSILLMNVCTPMIDRFTKKTVFGGGKKK